MRSSPSTTGLVSRFCFSQVLSKIASYINGLTADGCYAELTFARRLSAPKMGVPMKQSAMRLPSGGVLDLDENVSRAVFAHLEVMVTPSDRRAERRRDAALSRLDRRQLGYLAVVGSALRRLSER